MIDLVILRRRTVSAAVAATFLFFGSFGIAHAEGGCPPGQYPIGGQGVQGCAPMSGASSPPPAPRPTGKWIETWGALALSPSTGDRGVATGERSRSLAVNAAISQCLGGGATDCETEIAYKNQCVAVARLLAPNQGGYTYSGAGEENVKRQALKLCAERGGACEVRYTNCTLPIFEKF